MVIALSAVPLKEKYGQVFVQSMTMSIYGVVFIFCIVYYTQQRLIKRLVSTFWVGYVILVKIDSNVLRRCSSMVEQYSCKIQMEVQPAQSTEWVEKGTKVRL